MREIKFKVFMKNGDKYTEMSTDDLFMNLKGELFEVFDYEEGPERLGKEYELFQYTGLLDSEGVDIFEGDLFTLENNPYKHSIPSSKKDNFVVRFKDGAFFLTGLIVSQERRLREVIVHQYTWQRIGHIKTHPELLEKSND